MKKYFILVILSFVFVSCSKNSTDPTLNQMDAIDNLEGHWRLTSDGSLNDSTVFIATRDSSFYLNGIMFDGLFSDKGYMGCFTLTTLNYLIFYNIDVTMITKDSIVGTYTTEYQDNFHKYGKVIENFKGKRK
jgi:hypothetical protein